MRGGGGGEGSTWAVLVFWGHSQHLKPQSLTARSRAQELWESLLPHEIAILFWGPITYAPRITHEISSLSSTRSILQTRFSRHVSSIPFILKSTWCLTSTETIRLIRDGAFHPSDAHPFHRGFLVDFFQETSTHCPKNLPPPVSLATHFSQETPTLYPQDLRPPVSLARSTPIVLLRHPPFTYRIYLHPFSFHRDISASSSVVLGHAFCHELTNYPFLSWDHHLPLSWSSAATPFFHEFINCPFPVGTFTYEIISYPFHLDHQLPFFSWDHQLSLSFMRSSTTPFLSWDHQLPFPRWYFHLWDQLIFT